MARGRDELSTADEGELAAALRAAAEDKRRVVVTRQGRPRAALEDLDLLEALEERLDCEAAHAALRAWEAEGSAPASLDDVLEELGTTRADLAR